ncbi:MAG TPA: glycosyltransferase [Candidatus Nitrosocosmicus sp.]|nr:glycosyltransferase [Candidatus Nitrosocosmicus sp.]
MNILFIHIAFPSQFTPLSTEINRSKKAKAYTLCLDSYRKANQFDYDNLYSFDPDGDISKAEYYYSGQAEISSKISIGLMWQIKKIIEKLDINLIVAHHTGGSPHFLFDEINIPIITYIEFPSYRHHGWDTKYPPQDAQRYVDKNMEMLSMYQIMKSNYVIVPSKYSKKMLPKIFHNKIYAHIEGFDSKKLKIKDSPIPFEKEKDTTYIGYTGRVLSSEKGFEQFMKISQELIKRTPKKIKFIVVGGSTGVSYGYEKQNIEPQNFTNFKDYLIKRDNPTLNNYIFIEYLDYPAFSSFIHNVDFFLYPLQYGSGCWGLMEIFLRNKVIVASNRCYIPEIIHHGETGFLCDYDNVEQWISTILNLIEEPNTLKKIQTNIERVSPEYYIENVLDDYLKMFRDVIEKSKRDPT